MKPEKQVDKKHYQFKYLSKAHWNSIWHQLAEVLKVAPNTALEIGVGTGVFKQVAGIFGVTVKTLDIAEDLSPDYVGSVTNLPFADNTYEVVCAFQVLEHMPYNQALKAFSEMARVSSKHIILSLPDAKPLWRYVFRLPKIGIIDCSIPKPFSRLQQHKFDGQHYWEINKINYPLERIISDFGGMARLQYTFRVKENPYHRFMVYTVT